MSSRNRNGKYQITVIVPDGDNLSSSQLHEHRYDDFIEAWMVVGRMRKRLHPPPMMIVEDRSPFEPKNLELA